MPNPAPTHAALFDRTIAMIAEVGLEKISLRAIAAQAGCTTAVIFQQYQSKAGLIEAALAEALVQDEAAHAALLGGAAAWLADQAGTADFIASYVGLRSRQPVPRFWSEMTRRRAGSPPGSTGKGLCWGTGIRT